MSAILMYVLPALEALIIVLLLAMIRRERRAAVKLTEELADVRRNRVRISNNVRLPTKEEIAAARERGDDWKFHNPVPQPTQIVGRPAMQRKR